MPNATSPQELLASLSKDALFKQWQKQHPGNFLTHFFTALDSEFNLKSNWEVGFFAEEKITVFVPLEQGFEIKPADEIFRKKTVQLEPLVLDSVKLSVEKALNLFKEKQADYFPQAVLGDGFVILQTCNKKILWNFTFITKQLKFVNLKIDAVSGKVAEHQEIDLVQR